MNDEGRWTVGRLLDVSVSAEGNHLLDRTLSRLASCRIWSSRHGIDPFNVNSSSSGRPKFILASDEKTAPTPTTNKFLH